MATSKTGGSRAYLRGRVGSDVYSIGKDAKGKKQQVVRSLAESVKNPQTQAQMFGRMIMSTVMQAVSAMRPIIDHSFDNVPAGQPNVSEFIKRNYALISADAKTNESANNTFGLNKYQEKGAKFGAYVISVGSAIGIKGVTVNGTAKTLTIALGANATMGDLKAALGLTSNDYFTACAILANGKFAYERFHLNAEVADNTAISAENVDSLFLIEGNLNVQIALSSNSIVVTLSEFSANYGIIVSRKDANGYTHSACQLATVSAPDWNASVALPTYPVGTQKFLNGGGEESEVSPFEPAPFDTSISSATFKGAAWAKGATVHGTMNSSDAVEINLSAYEAGHDMKFGFDTDTHFIALTGQTTSGNLPGVSITPGEVQKTASLWVDGVKVEDWGTITYGSND